MDAPILKNTDAIKALAEKLSQYSAVNKYDTTEDKEAWTLAHAFGDLEDSFRRFLQDQLPRLVNENLDETEAKDVLLEVGEEFRHILYHIKDPLFFRYITEEK